MNTTAPPNHLPWGRTSLVDMPAEDFAILKEKINQAAVDLNAKGYAVIPSLFTEKECLAFKEMVWDFLEGIGLERDMDYAKMKATQLPPHAHGIMTNYRMNHAKPFRELRVHPKILAVHSMLNGSSCLTSSLDRVNCKFPGRTYRSKDRWPHVDQNARNLGLRYVQSYITFNACNEESPQNRFYEGSHLIFEEYFKDRRTSKTGDAWLRLSLEDRLSVEEEYKCPLVKPNCPAGSMVLWDSRTIHDPDEGTNFEDGRLVAYHCYTKCFPGMGETFKTKKKNAFSTCRSTPHAPYPQTLFPSSVRTYDKPKGPYDEIPTSKLGYAVSKEGLVMPDEWEKHVFCFKDYDMEHIGWRIGGSYTIKMINPLEKEWFGEHQVVPKDGKPLLPYTPFSVPPIPYEGKASSKKEKKNGGTKSKTPLKRKASSVESKLRVVKKQRK